MTKSVQKIKLSFKYLLILFFLFYGKIEAKKIQNKDSIQIRRIFDMALENGKAYNNLRSLCKDVGNRLSGTKQADSAVNWGYNILKSMWVDTVYKLPVMVPKWQRGNIERAYIFHDDIKLNISSLGGSVGTKKRVKANVVVANGVEDLDRLGEKNIKGKIVFFNKPFDPKTINVFEAYGACVNQRYSGASKAAEYGAVGVLVRSMTLQNDNHPHTGSMSYSDKNHMIPAAAISTKHADLLIEEMRKKPNLRVVMKMNCKTMPDVQSYNVVAEIRGETEPETVITIGGHLDSWDLGEGAHDDGAGIVHSIEILNLIKANGYRPKHTIRVVLFMNEENGAKGGAEYAKWVKSRGEKHIMALESDAGGHTPRGFAISASDSVFNKISEFKKILEPYGCSLLKRSNWGGGVDINPLKFDSTLTVNPNMILMGFIPDSHRYFDYHHAETDVFENVHKRELELGAGAIGAIVYLIDKHF